MIFSAEMEDSRIYFYYKLTSNIESPLIFGSSFIDLKNDSYDQKVGKVCIFWTNEKIRRLKQKTKIKLHSKIKRNKMVSVMRSDTAILLNFPNII